MRRDQRRQVPVVAGQHHRSTAIVRLGKSQPAIVRRNFDAESPHLRQAIDYLLRDLAGAIDLISIHMLAEEAFELLQKRIALVTVFRCLLRKWKESIEIQLAHEERTAQAAALRGCLTRRLGHLERRALPGGHLRGIDERRLLVLWFGWIGVEGVHKEPFG